MKIKLNTKNPKTLVFNEIYAPIFGKVKVVKAHEGLVLHLMTLLSRNQDKDIINNFKCNAKTHLVMDETKFILFYAEQIHFFCNKGRVISDKNLPILYI